MFYLSINKTKTNKLNSTPIHVGAPHQTPGLSLFDQSLWTNPTSDTDHRAYAKQFPHACDWGISINIGGI